MTNDPNAWFLSSQALDQHETRQALATALPDTIADGFREYGLESGIREDVADDMAIELARAGFALVRITPENALARSPELPAADFLARSED